MNLYALFFGVLIALFIIIRLRKTRLEKKKWVYPVLLATFPVYYWVFAVYASDYGALIKELAIGFGFLAVAFIAYRLKSYIGLLFLALGYITHAVYDIIHNLLFYNSGTPLWWPEFCGVIDLLIGLYLVYMAFSTGLYKGNLRHSQT